MKTKSGRDHLIISGVLLALGTGASACDSPRDLVFERSSIEASTGVATGGESVLGGRVGAPVTTATSSRFELRGGFVTLPED